MKLCGKEVSDMGKKEEIKTVRLTNMFKMLTGTTNVQQIIVC